MDDPFAFGAVACAEVSGFGGDIAFAVCAIIADHFLERAGGGVAGHAAADCRPDAGVAGGVGGGAGGGADAVAGGGVEGVVRGGDQFEISKRRSIFFKRKHSGVKLLESSAQELQ